MEEEVAKSQGIEQEGRSQAKGGATRVRYRENQTNAVGNPRDC